MPEIHFTIAEETGELEMQIEGALGTSCTDVAKIVTEILGKPTHAENTREFYARANVSPQIQNRKHG